MPLVDMKLSRLVSNNSLAHQGLSEHWMQCVDVVYCHCSLVVGLCVGPDCKPSTKWSN